MADIAVVTPPPARRRLVRPSLRWPLGFLAAAVGIFVFYYIDTYFRQFVPGPVHDLVTGWLPLTEINHALVYVMAALGLNIVVGYAGLLDLGFVAFWAIGGYTAGWLMSSFFYNLDIRLLPEIYRGQGGIHISFWGVLVAAAILCAIAGVIIGAPTLRLKSDYLALVTLGFGEIIYEVFYNGDDVFGANISNGNQGITPVDSVRFFTFDNTGKLTIGELGPFSLLAKFLIFVGLTALILFASQRIREGKLGRAWLAIREDELAASAMGVPLMRTKLAAYALGAIAGGFAGAAFAIHVSGVLPDRFTFSISIILVAMVVLGGMGNIWGVALGALILSWSNTVMLPKVEGALAASPETRPLVGTGLIVVAIALVAVAVLGIVRRRQVPLLPLFVGVLAAVIGTVLITTERSISFQFLIFGAVLVLMMLFRREGLVPESRTRLVLHEQARTDAEALGADMEEIAPELELLPDRAVHSGTGIPRQSDVDRKGVRS